MTQAPDRAAAILARFNAAQTLMVHRLRDLPAATAEQPPDDSAWSAAQIGWHIALTHDWMAHVLLGSTPAARPAPAGFKESFNPAALPAKTKTVPSLEPPAVVGRDSALERLRASGQHLTKAIASLTPERGSGYVIALPYGTLSLFELADFAGAHLARHAAQVDRAVAQAGSLLVLRDLRPGVPQ